MRQLDDIWKLDETAYSRGRSAYLRRSALFGAAIAIPMAAFMSAFGRNPHMSALKSMAITYAIALRTTHVQLAE